MWKLNTDERIAYWRSFRKTLDGLPLEQAVDSVANFWQHCPFVAYYLDPTNILDWPDPWELIAENYYCDLAKALGMLYTICLTRHGTDLDINISIYNDMKTKYTYNLVVLAQGKYVINLLDAAVVNTDALSKYLVLTYSIDSSKLKLKIK